MRKRINLDKGWSFHRGEVPSEVPVQHGYCYMKGKPGNSIGVPSDGYDAGNWDAIELPHDFVIGDVPEYKNGNSRGFLMGETSWYRRRLWLAEEYRGKRITLHFEGIASHSEIYVNGQALARNFSAYNPVDVDITDVARFGENQNVIAVRVSLPDMPEGWWYQGGGIYRHVWLTVSEKLSVDLWGVFVHPEKTGGTWSVPVSVTLRNDCERERSAEVISEVLDDNGEAVASVRAEAAVPAFEKAEAVGVTTVVSPRLWDVDSPEMYTLRTRVVENGAVVDEVETPFGFREFRFDVDLGFFLNGRRLKIKGVCCHQDFGLTGLALPDSISRYRIRLLREMGANGYRSAHNMSNEATVDACDRLGMLVFDETRYFSTSEEGMKQLRQTVLRDRNHPSVVCWSVGNEEQGLQDTDEGRNVAARMHAAVKALDPTRPTTIASCGYADPSDTTKLRSAEPLDLLCYNYAFHLHDGLHARFSDKPFVVTESCALQTTRGHYFGDDLTAGYYMAYDHDYTNNKARFRFLRSESWAGTAEKDYVSGEFVWAGIEHRGETRWPRLCSQSGLIDLYLQKKDAYYQTKAQYSDEPTVHLVPSSWNFAGYDGMPVKVVAFTNCEETELFLNNVSLGRKETPAHFENPEWTVSFERGTLEAVGYRGGAEVCRDTLTTTGRPEVLRLRLENPEAGRGDVLMFTCYCTDAEGRFVPDADPTVFFTTANCELVGTGSDIADHVPPRSSYRRMRMGLISAAVRAPENGGAFTLFAEGGGLEKAYLTLER